MAVAQTAGTVQQRRSPGLLAKIVGAKSRVEVNEAIWGYIFLLPWVLGLLIFFLGPILASAYFSFTEYDVMSAPRFIGLENYAKAFGDDKQFWPSLWRTFVYAIVVVPLGLVGSLMLAILLNQGVKGTNIFRTLFFLPSLTPAVALALLWTWLFHPNVGPINVSLSWIGIEGPGWLSSKEWALPALMIISLWAALGGNTMLIFLAGLQGVPQELY
jgi:multiple sugar transport system permease protein